MLDATFQGPNLRGHDIMIWNWLISHVACGLAAAIFACVVLRCQIVRPL